MGPCPSLILFKSEQGLPLCQGWQQIALQTQGTGLVLEPPDFFLKTTHPITGELLVFLQLSPQLEKVCTGLCKYLGAVCTCSQEIHPHLDTTLKGLLVFFGILLVA